MVQVSFEDFYKVPELRFDISKLRKDLDLILEKKKFIKHKPVGRGFIYMPKISAEQYREYLTQHLVEHYFDNDKSQLISHLNGKQSLNDLL